MLMAWGEEITWNRLLERLHAHGLDTPLEDKALEQLIISQAFEDYHLAPMENESEWLIENYRAAFYKLAEPQQKVLASDTEKQYKVKQTLLFKERLHRLKQAVVPQEQVHQHFLDTQGAFERFLFQLLRVPSQDLAQKLYYELVEKNADFDFIVRQHGEGTEVSRGGLIGPIHRNSLHTQITNELVKLHPGQIAPPIPVQEGKWLVLRLIQHTPAILSNDVEKGIREKLFQDWFIRQMEQIKQQHSLSSKTTNKAYQ